METLMYIILALAILGVGYYINIYNGFVSRKTKIDESLAGIDVALSKRYNLIGNLVETVKGYAKHESDVLEQIIKLRNTPKNNLKQFNDNLTEAKHQLLALVENYPELKADGQFQNLQHALVDVEEHLQAARRLHNHNVQKYNTYIQLSPQNLFPPIKDASRSNYFEATTDEQTNVDITF